MTPPGQGRGAEALIWGWECKGFFTFCQSFWLVFSGGYRRRQGKGDPEEGREAGSWEDKEGGECTCGNREKRKDWSCLAWVSLLK